MKKFKKEEIFSIPNLLSYFRIILIPIFCWMYLTAHNQNDYYIAAGVLFISTITDFLDGKIARGCNMITELGKVIDPIADKLTHGAIALCLATRYPMMWPLIALMVIKEGYMGIMGFIYLRKGQMLDGAMWFGKVCTGILFFVMLILVLIPNMSLIIANGLIIFTMCVMFMTLILYGLVYRKMSIEKDQ